MALVPPLPCNDHSGVTKHFGATSTTPTTHRRRVDVQLAAGATAATALLALAARSPRLNTADRILFHRVNSLPDSLYLPWWVIQLAGVLGAPLAVAAAALWARKYRLAAGLILLVPTKLVIEHDVLKRVVQRDRPAISISGAMLRDAPAAGLAFPSGHAIVLFGMATLLSPYLNRRERLVVVAIAALAATARVYLGAHTPLDVLGGTAAGVALGAALTVVVGVSPPRGTA